jgi:hypothetical protein
LSIHGFRHKIVNSYHALTARLWNIDYDYRVTVV